MILLSGVNTPFARAKDRVNGFIVEPGSNTSVTVRFLKFPAVMSARSFGLKSGKLTIASTSPVRQLSITAEPPAAWFCRTALRICLRIAA